MIVARGNLQYIEGLPVVIYLDEGVAYGDLHVHVHVCTVEGLPYGGDACCDLHVHVHVHVYGGVAYGNLYGWRGIPLCHWIPLSISQFVYR